MTTTDAMGYVAASLVLATFCAKQMVLLRALAISSNVAFITYGLAARLWPIVMLHAIMLPLNIIRLREAFDDPGRRVLPVVVPPR
jgi:CRP/FNR family transcriptional regulator, cyclic AMP receptor protein